MALEDKLNQRFTRAIQGAPWVLGITTGTAAPAMPTTEQMLEALTAAVIALHENVLQLAREIDGSR
jgi:hypothetical protein